MNKRLLYLGILCTALLPATANATDNDELNDTSRVYDIEEVFVIEQPKEAFRLRQQPLSSLSFNGGQLKGLNVQDLRQLSAFVPSFAMPEYGSRLTSSMYVRGIGSRINSPAVGIYVDGMPIQNKSAFNFHIYGIERVDVLNGPQGTLYGMNTEGGLIRIYSKNPFEYQGTDVKLSVGNKFWRKAEVGHYARLNDKAAFSLSAFYDGQNGFFRNQFNGKRADAFDEFGGKGRFLWNPGERLSLSLTADYQYVRQNGFPYGQIVTEEQIADAPITSPYYGLKAGTQHPSQNRQSNYRRNMLNTGLGISYKGDGYLLSSMTSWQFLKDYMLMDMDYLPRDFMHLEQRQHQNALTEELSIKSKNTGNWQWTFGAFGSYEWLKTQAPVFFEGDMNAFLSRMITGYAYNGMLNSMAKRIAQPMIKNGMPESEAMAAAKKIAAENIKRAGGCTINMMMEPIPGLFHTPTFNFGVYHESNINLTERLRATLGLRYDYSHVAIDYETSARVLMDENVMGVSLKPTITSTLARRHSNHFGQLLPKVGMTYRFDNGGNVYATWSKGYRAGGYNFQMFSDILQSEISAAANTARGDYDIPHDDAYYDKIARTIEYKPETSWNYEVGAHLNLMGGQMKLDAAAYYMQIRNQQLSVMSGNYGFGRMMTNAGRSHSCGLEATLRGKALADKLNYALSYGFTSARFDEYADSTSTGRIDYNDNKVPFVPQHTLSANADYRIDVDPAALLDPSNKFRLRSVTVGLNLAGQGKTYWDEANSIGQNFYATLGAHADADFGPLNINLWVRNLTDTRYDTFAVQSAATGTRYTFAQLGNPFQIGVDLSFHF
ncbi:TonB-dependent receptor [Prevotella sp. HUN102]|uniref:TonB-dependent receptor n=1 Tax=Prevotella sp. HUN102 TaxID=1392486 RepID=UPI00048F5DF1|nr:TonB-dependent receptor [Prevotella sp. HUN102]